MKFTQALATSALAALASATPIKRAGGVKLAGVNIAGFDFGCDTSGHCDPAKIYAAPNADAQMQHFTKDAHLNTFRLPVGWQYLLNKRLGGKLDEANMAAYDRQLQACLATGATCIIDIHNYARWDGQIVGQGGPSNEQFADVWTQLATKYADQSNVAFGLMNEPHDVPDLKAWAASVQAAVTAIRDAGAKTQLILLPGNNYTSASAFVSNGSLEALRGVTNPDGTTDNLIFDVHQYLDADSSGTNAECVRDNVDTGFKPLADALRAAGRMAILSETGGGNTDSCIRYVCAQLRFLK